MENFEKVIEYQGKLLVLIKKFEKDTRELLTCDLEEVTELVNSRQRSLDSIGAIFDEILRLCPKDTPEYNAFRNSCDRESLSDDNKRIFDLRMEFNACAIRAKNMAPEIIERLEIGRDSMREKIMQNNSGQSAKAAKFFQSGLETGEKKYFPENKRKI